MYYADNYFNLRRHRITRDYSDYYQRFLGVIVNTAKKTHKTK
jgi:hypothetical protein